MSRFILPTSLRVPNENMERHTTWLEIFFDLIFAVIVVQISDRLSNHLNIVGALQSAALIIPVMWAWASYTVFAARFDNNDSIHWLMTFVIMFAGAIMAIHTPFALEKNATGFSVGFLISQISLLLLYLRTLNRSASHKNITLFYLFGFSLGGICWLFSLFVTSQIKLIFWTVGMSIYLLIPWFGRKRILSKAPLDTIYIPERFGAFTMIVLGRIIASEVLGLASATWNPSSVFISVTAFILAILIWAQYYLFTQIADYKCTLGSGQPYIYSHIPLIVSLMLIGVCAKYFITHGQASLHVNFLFCFAIILYLSSFYLLQYIAIRKFKIRRLSYIVGIIAVLALFYFFSLFPMIIMTGIVLIFFIMLGRLFRDYNWRK